MTNSNRATSSILGYPRIGGKRELKKALESYWKEKSTAEDLFIEAKKVKGVNYSNNAVLDTIPVGDFSFYDQVLDHSSMVGVVPEQYIQVPNNVTSESGVNLNQYFAQARGYQKNGLDLPALEMTKWFDTNYHYIVPIFSKDQMFNLQASRLLAEIKQAVSQGFVDSVKQLRPVIIGPVSYLLLGKVKDGGDGSFNVLDLLDRLIPIYTKLFSELSELGVDTVQLDEPFLSLDLSEKEKVAFVETYEKLSSDLKAKNIKLFLASYFEEVDYDLAFKLNSDILHLDFTRSDFSKLLEKLKSLPATTSISCGIVNGRNIWKNNLTDSLEKLEKVTALIGIERVLVSSSCSLLHSPVDLSFEDKLDAKLLSLLSFAVQKVKEIATLTKGLNEGREAIKSELTANQECFADFKNSDFIHKPEVQAKMKQLADEKHDRPSAYPARRQAQKKAIGLPKYPSTTIGSFPQTPELRKKRLEFKKGKVSQAEYDDFIKAMTKECIEWQDAVGLDVLVHGEFERNDMVEYFGENLDGFAFTANGWVQSYGSRCVKPPIIYGDVSRNKPMTVEWSRYANSISNKPMKAMLTGPITILKWSFVREDQTWEATSNQLALALRDEVLDLEENGLQIIQIDEAAFREALPLKKAKQANYLRWAVESFKITVAKVKDETQIHTHMCYSDFNSIMGSIIDMDADVISIEASRSDLDIFSAFKKNQYPNEIGLGVYDIHSPRVPSVDEMLAVVKVAKEYLKEDQIWINPDCGLKTRGWPETKEALVNMVKATKRQR